MLRAHWVTAIVLLALIAGNPRYAQSQTAPNVPVVQDVPAQQQPTEGTSSNKTPQTQNQQTIPPVSAPKVVAPEELKPGAQSQAGGNAQEGERFGKSFWDFTLTDTLLALFTFCLVGVGVLQVYWMWRTISDTTMTSVALNRAFVFPVNTDSAHFRRGDSCWVTLSVVWENQGNTPARHAHTWVNSHACDGELPEDFTFRNNGTGIPSTIALGPGQQHISRINAGFGDFRNVWNGTGSLYVYGSTEYDDAFPNTERHRTEFCYRVKAASEPTLDKPFSVAFEKYTRHNGYDDDCTRQPTPFGERAAKKELEDA